MLDKRTVENLAADLFRAERAGVAMTAASALQPELDMDDAYAVQAALTALKIASGDTAAGYKIGLTSQPLQIARGTNEPIYGRIMSSGVHSSGCDLPMASFIQPRIEVELAFVLKTPLVGPGRTLLDAVRAVEYVLPALELVDTRVTAPDGALRLEDFVCDNSFGAGAVIGSCPFTPDKADLRWVSAICLRNGVIEDSGVPTASPWTARACRPVRSFLAAPSWPPWPCTRATPSMPTMGRLVRFPAISPEMTKRF